MRQESMEISSIVNFAFGIAGVKEGSFPGPNIVLASISLLLTMSMSIHQLGVPGEALVQGRKIGFRNGSHW